jgi:hypothetical protein
MAGMVPPPTAGRSTDGSLGRIKSRACLIRGSFRAVNPARPLALSSVAQRPRFLPQIPHVNLRVFDLLQACLLASRLGINLIIVPGMQRWL